MKCERCGSTKNLHRHHVSYNPEKIQILCARCHHRLHIKKRDIAIRSQYFRRRIKVPRSSVPFFQKIYPKFVDQDGTIIFDGEKLFNARYEVVDDNDWESGLTFIEIANEAGSIA